MDIKLLQDMSNKRVFLNGQVVFREGDAAGNEMYIILSGKVGVYKNYGQPEEVQLAELTAGDFFGEMTLFLNNMRSATTVAAGAVILLEINRMNAFEFFEKQPEATYSLIKTLCTRLDEANDVNVEKLTGISKKTAADTLNPAAAKTKPTSTDTAAFLGVGNPNGLFPPGHKTYALDIKPPSQKAVVTRKFTCPVCDAKFSALAARTINLKLKHVDRDFRTHYETDIDVIHYDIVTCPECYYSTFSPNFASPVISALLKNLNQVKQYKDKIGMTFGDERDIDSVFAGFYLTLKSGPAFFLRHETTTAKAWLRLMWLYQDCGDKEMELFAAKNARDAYLEVYTNTDFGPDAMQQLNMTLGELCLKLGDIPSAKKYYFQAKTSRSGKPMLAKQADERLNEIRESEGL